ncbi:MAG: ABC transporter permease [Candidatus Omnitrophica bacterium]|nr:ABC transporter permease [Candidatus Omnitrophota bacterium]
MLKLITNPIGVTALSRREIVRFLAVSIQTIFPPWISSVLFIYIFGVAIGRQIIFTIPGITYLQFIVPGLMAMHLISSSYENTAASLFIGRWHNNIQEVLLSPLSYLEMVLGLLAGGLARGALVCLGVFAASQFFMLQGIEHPFFLIYFIIMTSTIFSCAGMLAALWAEDFGMLNLWNVYIIFPMVILGGVFHPLSLLPLPLRILSHFNPIHYLVCGIRYSIVGYSDQNIWLCAGLAVTLAAILGFVTVYLFKIGYKLRT